MIDAPTEADPTPPGPPVVELDGVRVTYGDVVALDLDRLVVGHGVIGLLGPNGAGKSTLLRTILGFRRPQQGTVRVFGLEVGRHLLEVRQRIGYVPENDVTSPSHSAVSFVSYCGELCGMKRTDAMRATHQVLNYVGLGDERYRKIQTYSLGMRQRVKLAQSLVHDPELLFLDEPTNGLDPKARLEMLRLIREVADKRGVTVILSTHLLPDVEAVCDEVVVLGGGRVRRQGTLTELLASQDKHYEVGFVGDAEAVAAVLDARGITCRPGPRGKLVVELGNLNTTADLASALLEAKAELRHLEPLRKRLEEVFLAAVREGSAHAGV